MPDYVSYEAMYAKKVIELICILLSSLLMGCLWPEARTSDRLPDPMQVNTLTNDGVWCWFSDPRVIYYKGKNEKIYVGAINSRGDVMVYSVDLMSSKKDSFPLHKSLEIDDHNVPSFLILPDGQILAFYNEHNGNVYMRRSVYPENIRAWEDEQIIAQENEQYNYTYTNPVRLENEGGRIYLFGRKVGPTRSFDHWWPYFKYSDDGGSTWTADAVFLDNRRRKNPPYFKVATDHLTRIDFLFTDGHPKIGSDVSVYHMYYQRDTFFQTTGAVITTMDQLPIAISTVDKVYDASQTNIRAWIWDIALKDGNPIVTYARYPTEQDHIYHYAYWKNAKWTDHEIVNSGGWMPALQQGDRVREAHYSGGIVLDHQNPDHIYLSRNLYGKFEIEHRQFLSGDQWFTQWITEGSQNDNVRPYVVYQSSSTSTTLIWMSGTYRHYTQYETGIKTVVMEY